MYVSLGLCLAAAVPSNKATCPGYGHYRVLGKAGVGLGQKGEDRQAGYGGLEREWDGGSIWTSGVGQNGHGLSRPAQWGGRHGRAKISTKISTLVGYVLAYGWFYGGRLV